MSILKINTCRPDPDVSIKDAVKLKLLSILVESTKLPSQPAFVRKKVIKKKR
jgi:hypothetical protein